MTATRYHLSLMIETWAEGEVPDVDAFLDRWAAEIDSARAPMVLGAGAVVEPSEDVLQLIVSGILAFELTRDYVGRDTLPAIEGWSWFDWCEKARLFLEALGPSEPSDEFFTLTGDGACRASAWAWQLPGVWVAVDEGDLEDWLDPSDLASGVYAAAGMPNHWHRPISSPPVSATLRWWTREGVSVTGHTDGNGSVVTVELGML